MPRVKLMLNKIKIIITTFFILFIHSVHINLIWTSVIILFIMIMINFFFNCSTVYCSYTCLSYLFLNQLHIHIIQHGNFYLSLLN